jgi:hypothetical protein
MFELHLTLFSPSSLLQRIVEPSSMLHVGDVISILFQTSGSN